MLPHTNPTARKLSRLLLLLTLSGISASVWLSCGDRNARPAVKEYREGTREIHLQYANGFSVRVEDKLKWVEVLRPYQGAATGYKYLLIPWGEDIPAISPDVKVVRVPLRSIVCTSTSHLPLLEYLGEANKLVGFPATDYISSEKIRARVDSGKVLDIGVDKSMNVEQVANLHPDLVMGYSMSADYGQFRKMEALGVPVVLNAEYLERHPLGRAEWIKFMALFFDKEAVADSVFKAIEKEYVDTRQRADNTSSRPTVLSGIVYGDAWFMPGGQNHQAQLLRDAGCQYLWEADSSTGFLELGFESVYEKAHDADLWVGVGSYSSLRELGDADHRYQRFKPFRQMTVYSYDARKGARGGSVYLELGYLRPDIVLKDLVHIAHPEQLPGYTPYFHRKLE